jgi:hypothetical protein
VVFDFVVSDFSHLVCPSIIPSYQRLSIKQIVVTYI